MKSNEPRTGAVVIVLGVLAALAIGGIAGLAYGIPAFNRYQARLHAVNQVIVAGHSGEASLARAENEKRVMIETARAELEAAELRSQAIAVMGEAAQRYPEYRQQEFIAAFGDAIKSGAVEQIIYVPTEANIPIVEAGRRQPLATE